MDLNYILGQHQVAMHHAASATTPKARLAHQELAANYANCIRAFQASLGVRSSLVAAA
ncbi:hypothetical protein [Sphingomonas guangdongensis]|uniref:hypothetical protein n=1 Tax=Sphingomonas guangdongensis TaxID=1141890 RepID=UPI0015CDA91C|nr:hypothetical protein [Sphingomonas guangdongensis]